MDCVASFDEGGRGVTGNGVGEVVVKVAAMVAAAVKEEATKEEEVVVEVVAMAVAAVEEKERVKE